MHKYFITLIGCGAQAKYAIDIFTLTNCSVKCVIDPIGKKSGQRIADYTIESLQSFLNITEKKKNFFQEGILICLSDTSLKADLFNRFKKDNLMINAIHPDSTIAPNAVLGRGIIVNARAVIQPMATIGDGCMIHAGVVVEHDNVIDDFVNLAPGVIMGGGVKVGRGTTIFTGSIVKPNVKIGQYGIVGAGSLVLDDVPDNVMVYGNPAQIVKVLDE